MHMVLAEDCEVFLDELLEEKALAVASFETVVAAAPVASAQALASAGA